ncbi:hypothetical protein BWQ96_09637 [Gracilariopsis chorda]|uniref:Hemerythrin-like domain-containing protein n=1 Tax=Gracilariopsis chorda TaxID=448386 RepID=A0A2V3IEZ6_9FLOR|nr:hypothetical protein BWQ96_09637 [Gracilariopsis chorda]|eukprot:PXF40656.1 hypothetical protein BWQ96_09637 [Gracilariopsis chorda]
MEHAQSPAQTSSHSEEPLQLESDFVCTNTPERKSVRLSSALLNYTRPTAINPLPLGSTWALDLPARLHNAIRRELIDLYNMVDSMKRRVHQLGTADMRTFFSWWRLFSSFLKTVFLTHTQVIFPWLSAKTTLPDAVNDAHIQEVQDKLQALLKEFRIANEQLSRRAPDETLARIIKGLIHMHIIVQHLESVESALPDVIEQHFQPTDQKKIEKKVASFLHSHGRVDEKKMHLLLVANAMNPEALAAWNKMLPRLIRISYRTANKRFHTTHLSAVRRLAPE